MPKRQGRRSVAQTPAPPKERIKGSKVNPVGSASSEEKAKGIKLSENIVESLKSKVAKFKKENPKKKNVTLDDAKAVMRRGMGAYSTSHRPTITGGKPNSRTAWGFARVNKFLKKAGGEKVKKAYVQDDDLLKMEDGGTTLLAPNGRRSNLTPEQYKLVRTPEFKAWFGDWENDPENASKVVDDNGEPLVVYHGSENIFYEFLNKNSRIVGFYFSDSLFNAKSYGDNIFKVFLSIKHPFILNHNGKKFSDDLQIDVLAQYPDEKPYTAQVSVDIDEVVYMVKYGKRKNSFISVYNHKEYDGVIIKNIIDPALTSGNKILQTTYVSLESNQIKLSDGTNTTFDGSNPDIRFEKGGEIITCENCGWSWKESQTTKKDEYICHKCGFDNKKVQNGYKSGGETSKGVKSSVQTMGNIDNDPLDSSQDPVGDGEGVFAKGGNLKRLAAGFYEGVYNGLKFQITQQEINPYGGKPMWYYEIYNENLGFYGQAHDLYFTKAQTLDAVKEEIDYRNSEMKKSVEKEGEKFMDSGEYAKGGMLTDEDKKETYSKWKDLINMSKSELKKFYDSKEGKEAGISIETASKLGISRGRTSAKWIMKMKDTPVAKWTPEMWKWANKQISFVSRMRGNKGDLYDDKGKKTRKHTSLLIWGHNPEKYKTGGELNLEGYYEKGGDLISDLQNIDVSENIIELEEDWSGGVANFGDRSAAFKITKLPEYQDYKNNIENIIKSKYGKLIRVYRLMNQEQFDDWKSGNDIGYVSVSVDKKQAELFKKTPYYLNNKTKLVDFYAPVESVVMRGNTDEKELVLDSSYINMGSYGKGNEYDPQNPNVMYSKGGKLNLEGYYAKGGEGKTCEVIRNGVRQIDSKSIERLTDCVMKLPQTKELNTDEKGEYDPERKKLHKKIIYDIKKDLTCVQRKEPIAILMGGSPASGKSTFLKKYRPYLLSEEILKVDADEVRSKLPEYKGWNATQTHLETKDIVNLLLSDRNIGIPCAFDLIYDGTMNSTKSYVPLINLLKSLGYKVFIVYIDNVDQDIIKERALKRYQNSGRFVPLEVIDDFFTKGTAALESLKKMVDGYMVVDGSTSEYKVIERGGMQLPKDRNYSKIGTPIEVTEEEVVREYKKGGQTDFDPDSKNLKGMITHKSGSAGGMLVGKRHSEGGIKAINKSTGQPLEMEGGEVVITRDAVSDDTKREFEGQMMTNREILSKINESGGGVSFADGGDIEECGCTGKKFNYGGKTMTDYEIVNQMKSLYPKDFAKGKKEEMSEHKGTFEKLRRKGLTASQAADLVVAEHLKKKPDYYKNYKEGGVLDVLGKKIPSMPSFIEVGEPVMTPFKGLMNYFYQVKDSISKKMVYREGGHIRGRKISDLMAYKTYIYDNFGINFSELPVRLQNALTLGNQKMIDDYLKE